MARAARTGGARRPTDAHRLLRGPWALRRPARALLWGVVLTATWLSAACGGTAVPAGGTPQQAAAGSTAPNAAAAAPAPATTPPKAPAPVVIGQIGQVGGMLVPNVAKSAGYFTHAGLDASVVAMGSVSLEAAALRTGRIQFAEIPAAPVLAADSKGLQQVAVMALIGGLNMWVLARKGITSPQQLRGKIIAVSGKQEDPFFQAVVILHHFGLSPSDVHWLTTGPNPAAEVAAFEHGLADAMVSTPASMLPAIRSGIGHPLVKGPSLKVPFTAITVVADRSYLQSNPSTVQSVVDALYRGEQRFRQDPAFTEKVMEQDLHWNASRAVAAWHEYGPAMQPDPTPTSAAMGAVLSAMESGGVIKPGQLEVAQTFDASFMKRAVARGAAAGTGT